MQGRADQTLVIIAMLKKVGGRLESPCEEMAWVPVLANRDLEFSTRCSMMLAGQRSADQGNEWLLLGVSGSGVIRGSILRHVLCVRTRERVEGDGYRKGIVSSGDR
jgi:hypothetical protein